MELFQIFTIIIVALNFASSQQLGRTVIKESENGCTEAVKEYIGAQDGDDVTINYTGWLRDTSSPGRSWNKGKEFDSSEGGEPI